MSKIASQYLDKNVVFDGPSIAVVKHGIGSCFTHDGIDYWDDGLDDEQLDLLCGLYTCDTGLSICSLVDSVSLSKFIGQVNGRSGSKQYAYKSWWPTHLSWTSPLNGRHTGYWNEASKDWYAQCRASILKGKAQPLTSSKWRDVLRGVNLSHHLKVFTEQTAHQFITDSSHV